MYEVERMDEAEADHDNSAVADHPHHWMIESPTAALSKGVCNICGVVRDIGNGSKWEEQLRLGRGGGNTEPLPVADLEDTEITE